MGTFRATIEIGDPQGTRYEAMEALVDTGSTYTWVPRDLLRRLGVEPMGRREFETADGRIIEREVAVTMARYDGQALPTLVVFGEGGSRPLLGAYTLEGFGLAPDPLGRRLIPVRGLALKAIGIDLGTANSAMAVMEGGEPDKRQAKACPSAIAPPKE